MTVGEANGVTPDNAEEWAGKKIGKFNMIFQFEHLGLWRTNDTQFNVCLLYTSPSPRDS